MSEEPRAGRFPLQTQMLVGFGLGLVAGLAVHLAAADAPWVETVIGYVTQPIGQLFLRLLFMLVIPLLFSALAVGVAEIGDMGALKRVGLKTLGMTLLLSSIAVLLALASVNLIRPGAGIDPAAAAALLADAKAGAQSILSGEAKPPGVEGVLAIVPTNIVKAMAENDILGVMVFALLFGIGMALVRSPASDALQRGLQGLFEVAMRLIGLVVRLAPIAVFCFMFNLTARFGWDLLGRLGLYVAVVLLALLIQLFVVYSLALWLIGRRSPLVFFRGIQEAMVMAFSTASSNATLPTALRVANDNLRLPRQVSRFVLTIGASANQNGTAIFEGVTVLFLAQVFGVELGLGQQAVVLLVCILAGVGTAGVPAGSLPVIAIILGMVGVPPEGIGLVLGVDRLLDMCRTTLNVAGDLTIAAVVARGEPESPDEPAQGTDVPLRD